MRPETAADITIIVLYSGTLITALNLAKNKPISSVSVVLLSVLLTPCIGLLIVLLMKSKDSNGGSH